MDFRDHREALIDWVRAELIGPSKFMPIDSSEECKFLKGINPTDRFPCGAIYPVVAGEGEDPAVANESIEALDDSSPTEDGKEAEPIRRYVPPSSIGMSFYITGSNCTVEANYSAAEYRYDDRKRAWRRVELDPASKTLYSPSGGIHPYRERTDIWDGHAMADVLWRKYDEGWIVTVTLCNKQRMDAGSYKNNRAFTRERAECTIFEASFELLVTEGTVGGYPSVDLSLLDEEEREVELQYRKRKVYAIGHGTGVDWKVDEETGESSAVHRLWTSALPSVEVPQVTADIDVAQTLDLDFLASAVECKEQVITALRTFVQGYKDWRGIQKNTTAVFAAEDQETAVRIIERMRTAEDRMLSGIELLSDDSDALLAFSLANQAILDQMKQASRQKEPGGTQKEYRWRPFQLAFLLTTLESAANNESAYRDVMDLIWFPTGGGKTEAYLGLIAFVILLRRLKYPATSGGTVALMRYTLRLLTKDQYLRAARLICALELIRRKRDDLGEESISIGMWVGGDASPNTFRDAFEEVRKAHAAGREPSLVMDTCPWCGQPFSLTAGNYDSSKNHFAFRCTNRACGFGNSDDLLPCNVVDDHLYAHPPTLLISTVDKFARMAWEERAGNFFGKGKQGNRPPELIIQDELHLISGALGSINGIYEAAIDSIIRLRGLYPKYVASTATIRTARNQVRKLYGRDVAVFPPPGIDCDDSYFARTVPLTEQSGRLYLGYYAPMLNRQKCMAPLAAALLAAPVELFAEDQEKDRLLDAWWTSVIYHGSLKGVANSNMAFDSDVRDRLRRLTGEIEESRKIPADYYEDAGRSEDGEQQVAGSGQKEKSRSDSVIELLRQRERPAVEELTSHKSAAENAETFAKLAIGFSGEAKGEKRFLDAALATNMISVGLDVARLALMVINGQPLTTAEYIQASSRVGRSKVPGIVFANYYRDQARSLSHYEQFRAYHEAFYRYVEPSSVTPFTWQARDKALHAALVSVMRHGTKQVREASDFSWESTEVQRALNVLKKRCFATGDREETEQELAAAISRHIDDLAREWLLEAEQGKEDRRGLKYYAANDRAYDSLLCNYDDTISGLWPTMQSMRNVESTALIEELL